MWAGLEHKSGGRDPQSPSHIAQGGLHDCKRIRCYGLAMEDWSDARLILAVARAGTLTAAAKALRVDHSTVFRHLVAIEARMGPLFERGLGRAY